MENKISLSLLLNKLEQQHRKIIHFFSLSKQALTLKLNKCLNVNASHANHFIFEQHTKNMQQMPRTYCTATWKDSHEKLYNVISCNLSGAEININFFNQYQREIYLIFFFLKDWIWYFREVSKSLCVWFFWFCFLSVNLLVKLLRKRKIFLGGITENLIFKQHEQNITAHKIAKLTNCSNFILYLFLYWIVSPTFCSKLL